CCFRILGALRFGGNQAVQAIFLKSSAVDFIGQVTSDFILPCFCTSDFLGNLLLQVGFRSSSAIDLIGNLLLQISLCGLSTFRFSSDFGVQGLFCGLGMGGFSFTFVIELTFRRLGAGLCCFDCCVQIVFSILCTVDFSSQVSCNVLNLFTVQVPFPDALAVVLHEFSQFPLIVVFVKSTAGNVPEAIGGGDSFRFRSKHQLALIASCCRFTLAQLNGDGGTTLQQDVRCGNGSHALGVHVVLVPSHQNQNFTGGDVLAHDNAAGLLVIIRNLIIVHLRGEYTILNQDARASHSVKHGVREHGIHASTVRVHAHKPALGETDGPETGGRVSLNGSAMPDSFPVPTLFSLGLCHDDFVSVLDFRRREDALFDFAVGRVVVCQTQFHEDRLTTAVNVPFVDDEILSRRIRVVSFLSPHVSGAIVSAIFLSCTLE